MTRKEYIENMINEYRGDMIQAFMFDNKDIPFIMYKYDETTDCLTAGGVSVPFHYELDKITFELLDESLDNLELLLMEYYKNELGIILIYPED